MGKLIGAEPGIHLTIKFEVPSRLMKDPAAFIGAAVDAAKQAAIDIAQAALRHEEFVPDLPRFVPPPLKVQSTAPVPGGAPKPPSKDPYEECLACQ